MSGGAVVRTVVGFGPGQSYGGCVTSCWQESVHVVAQGCGPGILLCKIACCGCESDAAMVKAVVSPQHACFGNRYGLPPLLPLTLWALDLARL
jgi:hypothetical protein